MAPLNDKKIEKLQKILELANEDYATPDDLVKAMEAILGIINSERDRLTALIGSKSAQGEELNAKTLEYLNNKEKGLRYLISELGRAYADNDEQISAKFTKEIKRLEKKIPNRVDLTSIVADIESIREGVNSFPTELTANGEAVRDALELLQDDERLDKSAIKGLDEWYDELLALVSKNNGSNIVAGVRYLSYLSDVAIAGITNGQTIVWNSTTQRFEPGNAGSGSGHTIQDEGTPLTQRTNLNFIGTGVTATDNAGNNSTDITISSGAGVSDGDKGDITVSAGGATWTIDANVVSNAKLAQMATKTYKGRTSALTGNAEDVPVATLKTDLVLVKGDVGLGNVDNTSDVNKPVSTAQQTAIDAKVSDTAYDATSWNTVTTIAPSKNAVRDKIESLNLRTEYFIAAVDATAREIARADYLCDGTADEVQINTALDLIRATGGKVVLSTGTFAIAASINMLGNVAEADDNPFMQLLGAGSEATTLSGGSNINVISTGQRAKYEIAYFTAVASGSGDCISQAAGTERGNWQSWIHDVYLQGNFVNHTGWGLDMQSPFRMRFENIEMNGVANGARFTCQTNSFNPGNITVDRMFIDLWNDAGNASAKGFELSVLNSTATGVMNLVSVNRLDIAGGSNLTSSIGIHIVGATASFGDSRHHTFTNLNIEDIKTVIKMERGRDCSFNDINYTRVLSGGTFIDLDSTSHNNSFENAYVVAQGASQTFNLIVDSNGSSNLPNRLTRVDGFQPATVTINATLATNTILESVDLSGGSPTIDTDITNRNNVRTFADVLVTDEAYNATNWNGSLEVPTKNAVRDKIETMDTTIASKVASVSAGTNTTVTGTATAPIVNTPTMTATVGGAVPTPPNNTTTFLRGDGTFATPAGSGDMVLASAQTNSGLKTFLTGTFGLRNVANTFTALFTNANTTARTYTLKDADGTIAFTSDITGTNSGTNTGDVSLAGTPNYITIVGQAITRALIDLTSHVTGKLPFANIADVATSTVMYRKTAGSGALEAQTLATLKTDLGLTGTNSGDQTSIVGITGTVAQFNTAITDGDLATGGGTATGTNTGDNAVNSLYSGLVTNATHTGEVTGSTTLTLDATAITNRTAVTAVSGDYVLISDTSDGGLLKKALASDFAGGAGVSDGDKGDITVSVGGTVWTVDANAITFAKMQAITDGRLLGASGGTAVEEISTGSGLTLTANVLDSVVKGVEAVSGTAGVRVEDGVSGGGNIRIRRIIAGTNVTVALDGNNDIAISATGGGGGSTSVYTNQTPDNGTYALLSGTVNGSNTVFTVNGAIYTTGTLTVYLNGQLLTQGASNDWQETTPASGTFTFITAPATGDIITVQFQTTASAPTSLTTTEIEVDFGTQPTRSKRFTITDAGVSATTKILAVSSGSIATGRVGDDHEWDSVSYTCKSGTGQFILTGLASGRIKGKRKVYYTTA